MQNTSQIVFDYMGFMPDKRREH